MKFDLKALAYTFTTFFLLSACAYEGQLHPGKPPFVMTVPSLKNIEPSLKNWVQKHSNNKGYWVKQDVEKTYLLVSLGVKEGKKTTFNLESLERKDEKLAADFKLLPISTSVASQYEHYKLYVIKPSVKSDDLTINLEWATPDTQ